MTATREDCIVTAVNSLITYLHIFDDDGDLIDRRRAPTEADSVFQGCLMHRKAQIHVKDHDLIFTGLILPCPLHLLYFVFCASMDILA